MSPVSLQPISMMMLLLIPLVAALTKLFSPSMRPPGHLHLLIDRTLKMLKTVIRIIFILLKSRLMTAMVGQPRKRLILLSVMWSPV